MVKGHGLDVGDYGGRARRQYTARVRLAPGGEALSVAEQGAFCAGAEGTLGGLQMRVKPCAQRFCLPVRGGEVGIAERRWASHKRIPEPGERGEGF